MVTAKLTDEVEAASPVHHGHDGGLVPRPDDEVAFEATDLTSSTRNSGTPVDQIERPQWTSLIAGFSRATATTSSTSFAVQVTPQTRHESSGAMSVDALVDRLG